MPEDAYLGHPNRQSELRSCLELGVALEFQRNFFEGEEAQVVWGWGFLPWVYWRKRTYWREFVNQKGNQRERKWLYLHRRAHRFKRSSLSFPPPLRVLLISSGYSFRREVMTQKKRFSKSHCSKWASSIRPSCQPVRFVWRHPFPCLFFPNALSPDWWILSPNDLMLMKSSWTSLSQDGSLTAQPVVQMK